MDEFDDLHVCDSCGALHKDCVDVGDSMQCPSCCHVADLTAEIAEIQAELDETIADCLRYNMAWMERCNEAKRLRQIIEAAPHEASCLSIPFRFSDGRVTDLECDCFKSKVDEKEGGNDEKG